MSTEMIKTDEFYAKSEDGRQFLITEYTDYAVSTPGFRANLEQSLSRSVIGKRYYTGRVNVIPLEDGSYRILELDLVVHKIEN